MSKKRRVKRKRFSHKTYYLDDNTCCDSNCLKEAVKICATDGLVFCKEHAEKHENTVYSYKKVV